MRHVTAPGGATDTLGFSYGHRNADIGVSKASIVLNEGEGIAIIASCETAVTYPSFSGWPSLNFACQLDIEPKVIPTITISANVTLAGAEIRIYDMDNLPAGSLGTELSGIESCLGETYQYTGDAGNTVWIQIMKDGYIEFGTSLTLPSVSDYGYNITLQPDLSI